MAQATAIRPHLLKWARGVSGLSLDEAAARAKITDTKKATASEKLRSWEEGESYPTQRQLAAIAKAYQRPLITFFLDQPPVQSELIADFRTLQDQELETYSIELAKLLRTTMARQEDVRDLLLDDEDFERFPFIGAAKGLKDSKEFAEKLRQDLDLPLAKQLACRGDVFSLIRECAEAKGIFIQLIGDLGSYHSQISVDEFRGFVIADDVAPWIILNPNDAKYAHVFTLVHELAHLWLGEEGISNANPFRADDQVKPIERFCNKVAAEFLLPEQEFLAAWGQVQGANIRAAVATLKRSFCVSHTSVACRLWNLKQIPDDLWWELFNEYRLLWLAEKAKAKAKAKENDSGIPYWKMSQYKVGKSLVNLIGNAVDAQSLSMARAGRILGINPLGLNSLREAAGG